MIELINVRPGDFLGFSERWERLGAKGEPSSVFEMILTHHSEPHRGHHNFDHVAECLGWVDELWTMLEHPLLMAAAFDFHDIFYDPAKTDNEERSAELAVNTYSAAGLSKDLTAAIYRLIMISKAGVPRETSDEKFQHDIDYWILGSPAKRYARYAAGVRKEYTSVVTPEMYNSGRAVFLKEQLGKARIFDTDYFHERFHEQAIENASRELEAIS